MKRRRTRHDVARPSALATAAARAIGDAEAHRDRARAKLIALAQRVAVDRSMGHDMTAAEADLAELRRALSVAEDRLDAARALMGPAGAP